MTVWLAGLRPRAADIVAICDELEERGLIRISRDGVHDCMHLERLHAFAARGPGIGVG